MKLDSAKRNAARRQAFDRSMSPLCHHCLGSLKGRPATGVCEHCGRSYTAAELAGGG
jgi:hypothetical protein